MDDKTEDPCNMCSDGITLCISCDGRGMRLDGMTYARCRECFGLGEMECSYC